MAQFYNSIKTMKTARVGTILPWAGDGNKGFLPSNIPKGCYIVQVSEEKNEGIIHRKKLIIK